MKRLNLREYYPHYKYDVYVELPNEVAAAMCSYHEHWMPWRVLIKASGTIGPMDNERFYPNRTSFSLEDGNAQLQRHQRWDNKFPLLGLGRKLSLQYWRDNSACQRTRFH